MILRGVWGIVRSAALLPLVAVYVLVREWKRVSTLLVLALAVSFTMPMEAASGVVYGRAADLVSKTQVMYNELRTLIDQPLACTTPILVVFNRITAMFRAIAVLVAEDVGFTITQDVHAEAQIVDVSTYCEFTSALQSFIVDFISLVFYPLFLFLEVIKFLAPTLTDIASIATIETWTFIRDVIFPVFLDMIQFFRCLESPPNSVILCMCEGRFDNITIPSNPITLIAMCMNKDYNGDGDPILCGVAPVFGSGAIIGGLNQVVQSFAAVISALQSALGSIVGIANDLLGAISNIEEACSVYNGLPSVVKKVIYVPSQFFDLCDTSTSGAVSALSSSISVANTVVSYINSISLPAEIALPCPSSTVSETPVRPRLAPVHVNTTVDLQDAFAAFHARVQATVAGRFGDDYDRMQRWSHIVSVFYNVTRAPETPPPRQIVNALRSGGVHARMFIRPDAECTMSPMIIGRPPDVYLNSDTALPTFLGASFLTFSLLLCLCMCPPACGIVFAFVLATSFGVLFLVFTNGSAQIIAALASGRINEVYALPTLVYAAQQVGANYMGDGLAVFDPVAFSTGLVPYLNADFQMIASAVIAAPFCALPFGWFCPPFAERGQPMFSNMIGSLYCIQGQACQVVANCTGRAIGCFDNMCRCWGSVPETIQMPDIQFFYTESLDCAQYGYTDDVLVPFLQDGGLSVSNLIHTLDNAVLVVWEGGGIMVNSGLLSPGVVGAMLFLSFVPCVSVVARRGVLITGGALGVQYAAAWVYSATGWTFLPDRGLVCPVTHLPSLLLWYMIALIIGPLISIVAISGILSAIAVFAVDVGAAALWVSGKGVQLTARWTTVYQAYQN